MGRIHWVHAGADALFGLRYLLGLGIEPLIWTRGGDPVEGFADALQSPASEEALRQALTPGDIVIMPRPTDLAIARIFQTYQPCAERVRRRKTA